MKLDKRLHLVIPVTEDDETTVKAYVHSSPVSSEIWELYWEPISVTFTRIMTGGHGSVGGPRIADKMLRKVATDMGLWEGPAGVQAGFIAEIHRLTNVLSIGPRGWQMIPFDEARKTVLEPEDTKEIEGALVFFTLLSLMHRRNVRKQMLDVAMSLWGAQIKLSTCTEFMNSLVKSTAAENSGETAAA